MLTGMIKVSDIEHARCQLNAIINEVDIIELRLDYYTSWDLDALYQFRKKITKPIIATIRKVADGGQFSLSSSTHATRLIDCLKITPEFIDIEMESDPEIIKKVKLEQPEIQVICSYHHLRETPLDLTKIYQAMQHPLVDYYKIIPTAQSSIDGLRLLHFLKTHNQNGRIIAHCMGQYGFFSRILNLCFRSPWTYINSTSSVLNHGLSINDSQTYRLRHINHHTQIFALLGKPVEKSPGHLFHNAYFFEKKIAAVYVKITISKNELPIAWQYIKQLDFSGLSITIPNKEVMADLLQSKNHKAVNTISCQPIMRYTNTDGKGAICAIKKHQSCFRKKILILGSGGSAYGIATALYMEQCQITIAGRNKSARQTLANAVNGTTINLKESTEICDMIIGTLPPLVYEEDYTLIDWIDAITNQETLFFDANYQPKLTPLLSIGKNKGAQLVYGEEMFLEQALLQQVFWETQSTHE